jgi:hypothetical protein
MRKFTTNMPQIRPVQYKLVESFTPRIKLRLVKADEGKFEEKQLKAQNMVQDTLQSLSREMASFEDPLVQLKSLWHHQSCAAFALLGLPTNDKTCAEEVEKANQPAQQPRSRVPRCGPDAAKKCAKQRSRPTVHWADDNGKQVLCSFSNAPSYAGTPSCGKELISESLERTREKIFTARAAAASASRAVRKH